MRSRVASLTLVPHQFLSGDPHCHRRNSSRFAKILFGATISRDTRMFGNKGLPTKHTKSHESFTT